MQGVELVQVGGETDLTEGLISEENGKNKSRFGNSGLQVFPSWRGGDRAQTSPDCCSLPRDLSAASPSTP